MRELTLDDRARRIVALLGKNGMGKSTLLKTIMGFLPRMAGRVQLRRRGASTRRSRTGSRRAPAIAYAPQEQALFQDLSVEENLRSPCATSGA